MTQFEAVRGHFALGAAWSSRMTKSGIPIVRMGKGAQRARVD